MPDDLDPRQFCDQSLRPSSSFSHHSLYTSDVCDKRRPPGPSVGDIGPAIRDIDPAVGAITPRLQSSHTGHRSASSDLWNTSAGLSIRAACPGFPLRLPQFDSEIVQSPQFDHVQPGTAPSHGPYIGGAPGIPDRLRPVWRTDPNPLLLPPSQRAFLTSDPRLSCLDPHRALHPLPYQPSAEKATVTSAMKSGMLPLDMKPGVPCRPPSNVHYISCPVTAGNTDISRPITYCDSYSRRPMTAGYSRPVTLGDPSPVNGGVHLARHLPYRPSSHNAGYHWHPSPSPDRYMDMPVRYRRRQDVTTPQWSPCSDHTVNRSPYPASKLPWKVEVIGQPVEGIGEQKAAEYGAAAAAAADDVSYRYQLVSRTETMHFIPSSRIPSHTHIPRSGPSVREFPATHLVSPRNSQLLPHSLASMLPADSQREMWAVGCPNSLTNKPVFGAVGCTDRSLESCYTDNRRTLSVKVEEEEIDILAKATEGLFSPGDGERFMAEDDEENCLLFEKNQNQESLLTHVNEAAVQWQAYAAENTPSIDHCNASVYCDPTVASRSYVECVCQEFSAPDVGQYCENGVPPLHKDDDAGTDGVCSESARATDASVDSKVKSRHLDSLSEMSEEVSRTVVTELVEKVTCYATEQIEGRDDSDSRYIHDESNCRCLHDDLDSRCVHDSQDCKCAVANGTHDDCDNISWNESTNTSVILEDSSYKITFSESDLYEMVDRIEQMDPTAEQMHLRKRPVCSLGLISPVKKRHKLSRSGTEHNHSVVYHIPETDVSGEETSNENGHLDSGCDPCSTAVSRNSGSNNSALLQHYSCAGISNADDTSGLNGFSGAQDNVYTHYQIENNEKYDTDGQNNTNTAVTPTQSQYTVTTTTGALYSVSLSDAHASSSQSVSPGTTTTHELCCVTTTTPQCTVATTTDPLYSVSLSDALASSSHSVSPGTTTTHELCCVTTTTPQCTVTTTTDALFSVSLSETHALSSQSVSPPGTTTTHELCCVATTTPQCAVATTTDPLFSVTLSDAHASPSQSVSSGTTTTHELCCVTTTTDPLFSVTLSDAHASPSQSVSPGTTTTHELCCVTTTTPQCTVTTTTDALFSVSLSETHALSSQSVSPPGTTTTHELCCVTTTTPQCTVTTTTDHLFSVTATATQPLSSVTTTNAYNVPTLPACSVVVTNSFSTCVEHTKVDPLHCGTVKYLSHQDDNQQENAGSRNCFDFLVGLTSGRRKCSPTRSDEYQSAVN